MSEKKAIVTGAGTGIGFGIAIELGKAGYDVVVHYYSSKEGAMEAVRIIRTFGVRAEAVEADLSDINQIKSMFARSIDFLGGLTLFVNNSGVTKKSLFEKTTIEEFEYLVNVDLKSAYFCVQQAANYMAENEIKGSIVVVSSNNAFMQRNGISVYGMIKSALIKMVKHAAIEYAKYGIRVNSIAPGWTLTPRVEKDNDIEEICKTIPLKRMAESQEIGQTVLFYDSPASASVTGNVIVADGGFILLNDELKAYGL